MGWDWTFWILHRDWVSLAVSVEVVGRRNNSHARMTHQLSVHSHKHNIHMRDIDLGPSFSSAITIIMSGGVRDVGMEDFARRWRYFCRERTGDNERKECGEVWTADSRGWGRLDARVWRKGNKMNFGILGRSVVCEGRLCSG